MPTLLATAIASAAGWIVDGALRPVTGLAASMTVSLVASSVVFLFAKRFLADLRDGS